MRPSLSLARTYGAPKGVRWTKRLFQPSLRSETPSSFLGISTTRGVRTSLSKFSSPRHCLFLCIVVELTTDF